MPPGFPRLLHMPTPARFCSNVKNFISLWYTYRLSFLVMALSAHYSPFGLPAHVSGSAHIGSLYLETVTGWARYIKLVRKYQFLNIICFNSIQATLLKTSDVVGLLPLRIKTVEGSTSRLMYGVHQPTQPPIAAVHAQWAASKGPT